MKKIYFFLALICPLLSNAQLRQTNKSIMNDISLPAISFNAKSKSSSTQACGEDTIAYAYIKASALVGIAISEGYALGQYFDAPDKMSISGVTFYAWGLSDEDDTAEVMISLYLADADTLPTGNPLQSALIQIDTAFGGTLSSLKRSVVFDSIISINQPYIITIETIDSSAVGVVANSYINRDGKSENLASGTVGGTWYNCMNLNISGDVLDCDILLEPHVSYSIYSDFSFKDCYNYQDSVSFVNTSSPLLQHRMYNRYVYYNLDIYSHRWNYGDDLFSYYGIQEKHRYAFPKNYDITLYGTLYSYRGTGYCADTTVHRIYFQPSPLDIYIPTTVCSGSPAIINAYSTGQTYWFQTKNDSISFLQGINHITDTLFEDYNVFVRAINEHCKTNTKEVDVPVLITPSKPTVYNDSVCLNASANLRGSVNKGTLYWYNDTFGSVHIDTGLIFNTGPLNNSKIYYAKANNKGCENTEMVPVYVNVSADNAPANPLINPDSLICLYDGPVVLHAISPDSIYWYNTASGGNPLASGAYFNLNPESIGTQQVYVEAFDGQCASSRIMVKRLVWNFPKKQIKTHDTLCKGESITYLYDNNHGAVRWYDAASAGNLLYDSNRIELSGLNNTTTFYIEPYSDNCKDTIRHPMTVYIAEYGKIENLITDSNICEDNPVIMSANATAGEVIWSKNATMVPILYQGETFTSTPLSTNTTFYVAAKNHQCIGEAIGSEISVNPKPNAGFNYQVNSPGDFSFVAQSPGLSYFWDLGDGNTANTRSISHIYNKNGIYTVKLICLGAKGCSDSSFRQITASGLAAYMDNLVSETIIIYPNPAHRQLNIFNPLGNGLMRITNMQGQLVYENKLLSGVNTLSIEGIGIPKGFYSISLIIKNKHIVRKFIVH